MGMRGRSFWFLVWIQQGTRNLELKTIFMDERPG